MNSSQASPSAAPGRRRDRQRAGPLPRPTADGPGPSGRRGRPPRARSPPDSLSSRSANFAVASSISVAVHQEQGLGRGHGPGPHRAGGAAVVDVERLEEVGHRRRGWWNSRGSCRRPGGCWRRRMACSTAGRSPTGRTTGRRPSGPGRRPRPRSNPRSARPRGAGGGSARDSVSVGSSFESSAAVESVDLRGQLVGLGGDDQPVHLLHAEPAGDELGGQPVEQPRVGRRSAQRSEVARRLLQALAEVPLPEPVDGHPGEQRILGRGQPVGERLDAAVAEVDAGGANGQPGWTSWSFSGRSGSPLVRM